MTREEILEMLLEVLDAPTECRIIVKTPIPTAFEYEKKTELGDFDYDDPTSTIYFMIDRSEDMGETACDKWQITSNNNVWLESSSSVKVADFIMNIVTGCNAKVYIDGF